jgi:hypothetical protein
MVARGDYNAQNTARERNTPDDAASRTNSAGLATLPSDGSTKYHRQETIGIYIVDLDFAEACLDGKNSIPTRKGRSLPGRIKSKIRLFTDTCQSYPEG